MKKTLVIIVICLLIIAVVYYFFTDAFKQEETTRTQLYGFGSLQPVTGTGQAVGCMDPDADNYSELATIDSGGCIYVGCTDPASSSYDPQANYTDPSLCIY